MDRPSVNLVPNRIPAAPIVEVLNKYLVGESERAGEGEYIRGQITSLAERADVSGDTLQKILKGRNQTIDFDLADRLLCKANLHELWFTDLRELYDQAVLVEQNRSRRHTITPPSQVRVCARAGCSVTFVPNPKVAHKQRFCSHRCGAADWKVRKFGHKTPLRGPGRKLEKLTCKNGHERTPENTGHYPSDGRMFCILCKRKTDREYADRRHRTRRERSYKLTLEQAREIKASTEPLSALARRFGVHKSTVWLVRRGKTWAHA